MLEYQIDPMYFNMRGLIYNKFNSIRHRIYRGDKKINLTAFSDKQKDPPGKGDNSKTKFPIKQRHG